MLSPFFLISYVLNQQFGFFYLLPVLTVSRVLEFINSIYMHIIYCHFNVISVSHAPQNLGSGIAGTAEYPLGANLTRHEFGAVEHYKSKPKLTAPYSPNRVNKIWETPISKLNVELEARNPTDFWQYVSRKYGGECPLQTSYNVIIPQYSGIVGTASIHFCDSGHLWSSLVTGSLELPSRPNTNKCWRLGIVLR